MEESVIDFFDLNLEYDSRLFIDPFLIKKSPLEEERALFQRFGDFFRFAYDKSMMINEDPSEFQSLKALLNFGEPKEIGLGYTENSHDGAGPGPSFADILLRFFVHSSAKRLIKEEGLYPDGQFNPVTLEIFIEGIGLDGLSDMTADIIMDYLISYTQDQCKIHNIPLKSLPVKYNGFDFEEMEWIGGGYHELPENPLRTGEAVILVPKRFLRATEISDDHIQTNVKGILEHDANLSLRFASFLKKRVDEISIEDIRIIFLEEESVFKKYIDVLTKARTESYDFEKDLLKILAIKSFSSHFANLPTEESILDCSDLLKKTFEFIELFRDQYSIADGWKDMWVEKPDGTKKPQREVVLGRAFRGMGYSYFNHFPQVSFLSEVGTGNGPVDFAVIYGECKIAIELKKLENSASTGEPPIPAYMHGIERQLPEYAYNIKATHAIYITGQHFTSRNRPKNHHDDRITEIEEKLPEIEEKMKAKRVVFQGLHYVNIDLSPKLSASNI